MWWSVVLVFGTIAGGCALGSPQASTPDAPPKGMEGRVVGGAVSRMNQFPYLIAVLNGAGISCGGSLVKPSLVLTAAHCWVDGDTKPATVMEPHGLMVVKAGEHNLKIKNEGSEQWSHIKRLVVHKDYDIHKSVYINDIALIEVDTPFNLTKGVATVPLASPGAKYNEKGCTVAGWGYTHSITEADQWKPKTKPMPDTPSFVAVDIIKKAACSKLKDGELAGHPSTLCAGNLAGGKGSCVGDSGGPLTCPSIPSGSPLQVGVVSGAIGCALPNRPTFFADVAFLTPWLDKAYKALEKPSKDQIIRV